MTGFFEQVQQLAPSQSNNANLVFGVTRIDQGTFTDLNKKSVIYNVPEQLRNSAGTAQYELALPDITNENGELFNVDQIISKLQGKVGNPQSEDKRYMVEAPIEEGQGDAWSPASLFGFAKEKATDLPQWMASSFTRGADLDPRGEDYQPILLENLMQLNEQELDLALSGEKGKVLIEGLVQDVGGMSPQQLERIISGGVVDNLDLIFSGIGAFAFDKIPMAKYAKSLRPVWETLKNKLPDKVKDKLTDSMGRKITNIGDQLQNNPLLSDAIDVVKLPLLWAKQRIMPIFGAGVGGGTGSVTEDLIEQGFPVNDKGEFDKGKWYQMSEKAWDTGKEMAMWETAGLVVFDSLWKLTGPFRSRIDDEGLALKDWLIELSDKEGISLPTLPSGLRGEKISWLEKVVDNFGFGKRSRRGYNNLLKIIDSDPNGVDSLLKAILYMGAREGGEKGGRIVGKEGMEMLDKEIGKDIKKVLDGDDLAIGGSKTLTLEQKTAKTLEEIWSDPNIWGYSEDLVQGASKSGTEGLGAYIKSGELIKKIRQMKEAGRLDPKLMNPDVLTNLENFALYLSRNSKPISNYTKGNWSPLYNADPINLAAGGAAIYMLPFPLFKDEKGEVSIPLPEPVGGGATVGEYANAIAVPTAFYIIMNSMLKPKGLMNDFLTRGNLSSDAFKIIGENIIPLEMKAVSKWSSDMPETPYLHDTPEFNIFYKNEMGRLGGNILKGGDTLIDILSSPFSDAEAKIAEQPDSQQYNQIIQDLKEEMKNKKGKRNLALDRAGLDVLRQ